MTPPPGGGVMTMLAFFGQISGVKAWLQNEIVDLDVMRDQCLKLQLFVKEWFHDVWAWFAEN